VLKERSPRRRIALLLRARRTLPTKPSDGRKPSSPIVDRVDMGVKSNSTSIRICRSRIHIVRSSTQKEANLAFSVIDLFKIGVWPFSFCLARHNPSVGGVGAVALWPQRRLSIYVGLSSFFFDAVLFLCSAIILPWKTIFWSMLGSATMHAMHMAWHKPGRYIC
jgi:hypothetical protein